MTASLHDVFAEMMKRPAKTGPARIVADESFPMRLRVFYTIAVALALTGELAFTSEFIGSLVSGAAKLRPTESLIGAIGFAGLLIEVLLGLRADLIHNRHQC
jgi:hypothetical protein